MSEDRGEFYVDVEEGLLVFRDDDGQEDRFRIEEELKIDGQRYMILVPEDGEKGVALRVEEDEDGQEVWAVIEAEEEISKIERALEHLYQEREEE